MALPYLFVILKTIIPNVISAQDIYLWKGILSPVGKIVLKTTITIVFEAFIIIFTGYETYIKADWEEIIEASMKKPDSTLNLNERTLFFSVLKKGYISKLRTTPTKHIETLLIKGKVNFPPLYSVLNLQK